MGFVGGVVGGGEMVFEGFNGLVDEMAVGRGVPADPETGVTVETTIVESGFVALFSGGVGGGGGDGAVDEVG